MTVTIPAASVPAVMTYLFETIQTTVLTQDPLGATRLVQLGEPGVQLPADAISIGAVRFSEQPQTFIGSGGTFWLNEKYTVTIEINSWQGDVDADSTSTQAIQVNNRAWQLFDYVADAVRSDPSLGGLVNDAYPSSVTSTGPERTQKPGYLVGITVEVTVDNLN